VGAIILGSQSEPLSWGYNGFPRGADDDKAERHERPLKYTWTEHAERNAIYNAARVGARLLGSSMYVTMAPCVDCARAIIQAGIKKLYLSADCFDPNDERKVAWIGTWPVVMEMFNECEVEVIVIINKDGTSPTLSSDVLKSGVVFEVS
jgi:dCMP deaminase